MSGNGSLWRWLGACAVSACVLTPVAQADQPLNISGTWSAVYHCKVGWCAGQDFPAGADFTQAPGSSTVTQPDGSGTLVGHTLTYHGTQGSYSYSEVLTFSADGNSWTGTLSDSHGTSGIDVGTRTTSSAPAPATTTAPTTTAPVTTAPPTASPYPSVVNGSFDAGNSGFTSAYTSTTSLAPPATYAIQTDPHALNGYWPQSGDHTTGHGQMLIANGSTTPGQAVWSETVVVQPNTTYHLSAWVASLYPPAATLQLSVNGTIVGSGSPPAKAGTWGNLTYPWQSGTATTATLSIADQNIAFGGNDFAVDDISFDASGTAAAVAHRNARLSTIASSITPPAKAFSSTTATIENAAIAAGMILFITFPSQLFNHTFEENYADIRDWWARRLGPLARLKGKRKEGKLHAFRNTITAIIVIALGGIFGGLLDPRFGWNGSSAVTYTSVICSTIFGLSLSTFVAYEYRKRRGREKTFHLHAIPAGLAIAAICVLTSRLTGFQPGYLYGLICGTAFGGAALAKNEQGHTTTLSVLATIAVALLAWLVWIPLNHLATHPHEAWPVVLGDDFVGALFTGGIVGSTIGLFPLRFLPGGTIAAWHRGAWAATFGFVVFLFLEVILNPGKGGHSGAASLTTAIGLFVLFGGGSVAFYTHFARKKRRKAAEEAAAAAAAAEPNPMAEPEVEPAPQTEPESPPETTLGSALPEPS